MPTTVLDAIQKSAGLKDSASGRIFILRGTKKLKFDYKELINRNKTDQSILLQPGDHVVVP